MSDSDRKEATREQAERSSKRSGVLRRGRRKDEDERSNGKPEAESPSGAQSKQSTTPGAQPSKGPPAKKDAEEKKPKVVTLDDEGKVSSLLETTGQDVKQLLKAADDAAKKIREAAATESDKSESAAKPSGDTGSLVGRINREVQQVLESADDAADKIRAEARAEARQLIAEARRRAESVTKMQMDRVSEMTDQVMEEMNAIQGNLARLQAAYDEAMKTMNADLSAQEETVWETPQNGEVEEPEETEELRARLGKRTPRKGAQEPEGISEGARLLALQQMMAGVDPEVMERRLRTEFGIEDPKPILDWMGLHGAPARPKERKKG